MTIFFLISNHEMYNFVNKKFMLILLLLLLLLID